MGSAATRLASPAVYFWCGLQTGQSLPSLSICLRCQAPQRLLQLQPRHCCSSTDSVAPTFSTTMRIAAVIVVVAAAAAAFAALSRRRS